MSEAQTPPIKKMSLEEKLAQLAARKEAKKAKLAAGQQAEEVEGWQIRWAQVQGQPEDPLERKRRYGLAYEVIDRPDAFFVKFELPRRVPDFADKYRFGLPEFMPDYKYQVQLEGRVLVVEAKLEDETIRSYTTKVNSFPPNFRREIAFDDKLEGFEWRYNYKDLEIVLFKAGRKPELYKWEAHFITDDCVGCGVCDIKCPTETIWGLKKERFVIVPDNCINCGVCGIYCPYDSILDHHGVLVPKQKPRDIPKAKVVLDLCSGCEFCIDICPFDCISLVPYPDETSYDRVAVVDEKECVSCKLCEQICIKEAIVIDREIKDQPYVGFGSMPAEYFQPRTSP
ncbi:MAG TPA: 4Fe-4S binding protein [Acidobacteriota bacterium]